MKKDVILGISAGERKKKKPRIRRITGLSVNDIKQIMQDRKKVVFINVLNSKKKKQTEPCLIKKTTAKQSFQNYALYIHKDHEESWRRHGLRHL